MILKGGRLKTETLEKLQKFSSSIKIDKIFVQHDIRQSMAHVRSLENKSFIKKEEAEELVKALQQILIELNKDPDYLGTDSDDVHMAVEAKLGDIGKKLHAGRSRNDQVACDMRMYVRDMVSRLSAAIVGIINTIKDVIEANAAEGIIMPAYTHMQRAQTITLAVYLDAYVCWFSRDLQRFKELYSRVNQMPLGAAACASSNIKLDRNALARSLDFDSVMENPVDAVAARDYILEFANDLSLMSIHLSRLAEEFILFSTKEYSFIELDDSIAETSSIMPQKKNPDCFELIRSASGRIQSAASGLAVMMKGLPLAYNRDMQNDRQISEAASLALDILELLPDLLLRVSFSKDRMREASLSGFLDAADFAEYLVIEKSYDFRDAHRLTGKLVRSGIENGYNMISEISLDEIRKIVPETGEDVFEFINIDEATKRRLENFKQTRSEN